MTMLHVAKKDLRKKVAARLASLPSESVESQSSQCVRSLLSMPAYQAAQRISIYLPMPASEIDTSGILRDAFSNGKEVFVPYINKLPRSSSQGPPAILEMLKLASYEEFASLERDKWGIPSLPSTSIDKRMNCLGNLAFPDGSGVEGQPKAKILDLIIVPGQAFDVNNGRLGHGKGFYDFFFARLQKTVQKHGIVMPRLVGLCLAEQLLEDSSVPMDDTDWWLDVLVVGDGRVLERDVTKST